MRYTLAVSAIVFAAIAIAAISKAAPGAAEEPISPQTVKQLNERIQALEKRVDQLEQQKAAAGGPIDPLPQIQLAPSPLGQLPQSPSPLPGAPQADQSLPEGWTTKEFNGRYYYLVPLTTIAPVQK